MASEIRVDKINSLSGVGTVTLSPTGVDIAGITTVATFKVGTGVTASSDGDIFATGVTTSTTFSGNFSGGTISGTTGTFTGDVDIADKIIHTGDTNTAIRFPAADTISFETAGSERFRLDSSGRLLYGHTSNVTGSLFQINSGANFFAASNDANGAVVDLIKTRSTTPSGNTILQDGDKIGELRFRGNTGAGSVNGAVIQAIVNGTPGSGNDLPTDLALRLQPDGSGNTNEVARFTSGGYVGIGENSPANLLHVKVSDTGVTPHASAQIVLERSGTNYLQFLTAADGTSGMLFGDANDNDVAKIVYDHNVTELQFNTETAQRMKITGGGVVQIGGNIANNADLDTSHSKLTIKQSSNNANGGIYLERSGERRGFYTYVGGGLSQSDALTIRSNQLGTTTDVLAIDRGGDVAIGAGDLFFSTSGKGIVLGATSNTAANTLDDYEEGNWTPSVNRSSSNPTVSYTYRNGRYQKIGNMVWYWFDLSISSLSGGAGGHRLSLPFTHATGGGSNNAGHGVVVFRDSNALGRLNAANSSSGFEDDNIFLNYIDGNGNEQPMTVSTGRLAGCGWAFVDAA